MSEGAFNPSQPPLQPFSPPKPAPVKPTWVAEPFRLRLWPAVIVLAVMLAMVNGPKVIETDNVFVLMICYMLGPLIGLVGISVWWLFLSRVSWLEGFGMLLFAGICGGVLSYFSHKSMGMSLFMAALPMVITVGISWLIISFFMPWSVRRIGLILAIAFTCFYYSLIRFDGVDGGFNAATSWRFDKTAEQEYLATLTSAKTENKSATTKAAAPLTASDGDWVSFRGPRGDSVYIGEPIAEDWNKNPPKQLWKRKIGPGWSSFVIVGNYLFTQEQRDKLEVVVAYDVRTGEPIWDYSEDARFEEYVAGPGPRATPLFHDGKIYVVGATGIVNCLDAATGKRQWRSEMVGKEVKIPEWGYSSSPIVVGDAIVTLPGKPDDHAVVAFDAKTGEKKWSTAKGEHSYTSAHLATICGVPQVLALTSAGLMAIEPDNGNILWKYDWDLKQVARCVQPYVDGDTVTISTFMGNDMRKLKITKDGERWQNEVLWKSTDMKPYYNDMVVQNGFAYGYDNKIFGCIDLSTGKRQWKGGRYGNGQVLLLAKQKKLLLSSEQGEVVLLEANPEKLVEVAKFKAIEGKTWNHPVIAHGKLFVRNGEEMACYDVRAPKQVAAKAKTP